MPIQDRETERKIDVALDNEAHVVVSTMFDIDRHTSVQSHSYLSEVLSKLGLLPSGVSIVNFERAS